MLTNENDIYLYFEIMRQLQPTSVLDVGMFLSRIGAVSRQAMGCEVPQTITLEGVCTRESEELSVYKTVYDQIYLSWENLYQKDTVYDMGVALRVDTEDCGVQEWEYLFSHCGVIVFEATNSSLFQYASANTRCEELTVDSDRYILAQGQMKEKETVKTVREQRPHELGDDMRLYVAAHKQFIPPQEQIYIPLHVGREGKEDLGYIGDNTGNHISGKNSSYCELTGLYWMWKNVSCDVIGLCHYRRYFARDGRLLTEESIRQILSHYDLILGNSAMSPTGSVYQHYVQQHRENDLTICRQVIQELCPDYLQSFDCCMASNLMNIGNMIITRKDIFDEYCEWLFPLLSEIEVRTNIEDYDTYQARLYGFLAERLLRVWVMNHGYLVREETVVQTDM